MKPTTWAGVYQEKLNRLRAAVLGANDGIVSVATTVVGVAGATASTSAIEMTEKNALKTHLHFELGIDDEDIPSLWSAAFASAGAFLVGATGVV